MKYETGRKEERKERRKEGRKEERKERRKEGKKEGRRYETHTEMKWKIIVNANGVITSSMDTSHMDTLDS